MKRSTIARLAVQAVAVCFGILGIMWVYGGCYFAFTGIRDSDLVQIICMSPMFLLFGGIVLAVSWQALRHFGPKAIQNVVSLIAFTAYACMIMLLRPFQDAAMGLEMRYHYDATFLIPMLLAYLLYLVLSRKLIEITTTESIQQDESIVPSKAALSASSDVR